MRGYHDVILSCKSYGRDWRRLAGGGYVKLIERVLGHGGCAHSSTYLSSRTHLSYTTDIAHTHKRKTQKFTQPEGIGFRGTGTTTGYFR